MKSQERQAHTSTKMGLPQFLIIFIFTLSKMFFYVLPVTFLQQDYLQCVNYFSANIYVSSCSVNHFETFLLKSFFDILTLSVK